jgi:CubicO group peptidase (beta-lactamase class C family)
MSLPAAAMWLDYKAPGFVLAAVRGTDAVALGFGETAAGFGVEPSGRKIVRIGSIAKVFAGQLLADLANGGKVRLADPAQRFLPEFRLPEAQGRPITLVDLATHTAGLPREVPGEPIAGADPFARFSWENYKCRPPIEMSPLSPFQMSLSSPDGCWERVTDDGDCDEPHGDRSDARAQGSGSWPDYGD